MPFPITTSSLPPFKNVPLTSLLLLLKTFSSCSGVMPKNLTFNSSTLFVIEPGKRSYSEYASMFLSAKRFFAVLKS